MYAKVFRSLFDGSMRGQSDLILVFVNLLCNCNTDGVVDRHWQAIADETGLPVDRVLDALVALSKPDAQSRSRLDDGRRIVPLDPARNWGWKIVNFEHYRSMRDEQQRRAYMREYMSGYRANPKQLTKRVNTRKQRKQMLAHTDTIGNGHFEAPIEAPKTGRICPRIQTNPTACLSCPDGNGHCQLANAPRHATEVIP